MTDDQTLARDPLHGGEAVHAFFGDRYPAVAAYAEMLADQGVLRGLIGPREVERLWERHLLNSAAVAQFLPDGTVADVGSGAGLPGLVIAAMQPQREVVLIEPMERRTTWLAEAARALELSNVRVLRGRAEEVGGDVSAQAVTARAVAAVAKLAKWCAPLLAEGGQMLFLKGRSAAEEIESAKYALRKLGLAAEVLEARTVPGLELTRVVRLTRG